jgi:hypothetical protein
MAALHMYPAATSGGMLMTGTGATAENFLLPLIIGISITAFILTATLALSPTAVEMREERELQERIEQAMAAINQNQDTGVVPAPRIEPGSAASRALQARRHGDSRDSIWPT